MEPSQEVEGLYQEQAELLSPYVDLLLCETMSNAVEGQAAARAACAGQANRFGWPGRCMKIALEICTAEKTLQKLWPLCRIYLSAVCGRIVVRRKALPRLCPNWSKRVPNGTAATPIRLRPFRKTGPWTEEKTQMTC